MDRYDWKRLNHLQVGRYSEYFVKMGFTLYGFSVGPLPNSRVVARP